MVYLQYTIAWILLGLLDLPSTTDIIIRVKDNAFHNRKCERFPDIGQTETVSKRPVIWVTALISWREKLPVLLFIFYRCDYLRQSWPQKLILIWTKRRTKWKRFGRSEFLLTKLIQYVRVVGSIGISPEYYLRPFSFGLEISCERMRRPARYCSLNPFSPREMGRTLFNIRLRTKDTWGGYCSGNRESEHWPERR
jgi:hypothetical protein